MSDKPLNPWELITDRTQLKLLGKLAEELAEAGAATSRCIIHGVDECEPVTGYPNRRWLEDEIADVQALIIMVIGHYQLNSDTMVKRVSSKVAYIQRWLSL